MALTRNKQRCVGFRMGTVFRNGQSPAPFGSVGVQFPLPPVATLIGVGACVGAVLHLVAPRRSTVESLGLGPNFGGSVPTGVRRSCRRGISFLL